MIIAIDGPAASGKGTLAKRIAVHFGLPVLDTGLLYRAVARDVVTCGASLDDAAAAVAAAWRIDPATLDDPKLRGPAAGDAASIVAKMPRVRLALLDFQRDFAKQPGGAVLDGRDIGTVICPDADVKIFVTATAEERARRRHLEHQSRGEGVAYEAVLADIRKRDERDSGRDVAPLEAAPDAITIDTTTLDADAAFVAALKVVNAVKYVERSRLTKPSEAD
jgi:CMP/dCMP kinase